MKKRKLVLKKDVIIALESNKVKGGTTSHTLVGCDESTAYTMCTCTFYSQCMCEEIETKNCTSVMPPVPETYDDSCAILTPSDNGRISCDTECFCNGD